MEDYKKRDREAIARFLSGERQAAVDTIAQKTGAEPLRIYPILQELELQGALLVTRRGDFGAPEEVEWKVES